MDVAQGIGTIDPGLIVKEGKVVRVIPELGTEFRPPARGFRCVLPDIDKPHVRSELIVALCCGAAAPPTVQGKIEILDVAKVEISAVVPTGPWGYRSRWQRCLIVFGRRFSGTDPCRCQSNQEQNAQQV